jgi:exodeoxyribonuclease VII small subunit
MAKTSESNFESSLVSLEQVVAQLESGDLPLERALALFEEGVGLARICQSQLEEAERKVEVLLRERGEIKLAPFDAFGAASAPEPASADPRPLERRSPDLRPEDHREDVIPF